jgi:hypothetical protein
MTGAGALADRVREAFRPTPRGVVGLVDDLVRIGREHPLRLDYAGGVCRVRVGGEGEFHLPVPKSVFRAALARVAALCNEQSPDAVTPYGGAGELPGGGDGAALRVTFTNTPAELGVDLEPVSDGAAKGAAFGNGHPSPARPAAQLPP